MERALFLVFLFSHMQRVLIETYCPIRSGGLLTFPALVSFPPDYLFPAVFSVLA